MAAPGTSSHNETTPNKEYLMKRFIGISLIVGSAAAFTGWAASTHRRRRIIARRTRRKD
jgi:hypothetical protein